MYRIKSIVFATLSCIATLAISIGVFAASTTKTVNWPTDKQYDANIFVADPSTELQQAFDNEYAARTGGESDSLEDDISTEFGEQYAALYTAIQPVDYLKLGGTTILQDPIPSYVNKQGEAVAVWNLPILQDGYYYQLAANNYVTIPDYTYPVLVLKKKPEKGTSQKVYLRVYPVRNSTSTAAAAQFIIEIPWNLSSAAVENPLMCDEGTLTVAQAVAQTVPNNIHSWCFDYTGYFRPYQTKFAVFCEDYVVALTEEPSQWQYYKLDNDRSLIMSRKTGDQVARAYYADTVVFEKGFLDTQNMETSDDTSEYKSTIDMDIFNMWRDESDSRITFALGPKQDIETGTVNSTHSSWHVKTKNTNAYERQHGAMAAFFNKVRCHVIVYYPGSITNPYTGMYHVAEGNRIWLNDSAVPHSLRQETGDYFLSLVVDNPYDDQVTPVGTDTDTTVDNYEYVSTANGEPAIQIKDGKSLKYYHNLSAISFWNAWMPTVGAIDASEDKRGYTIKLDANGGDVTPSELVISSASHEHINLPTPTYDEHEFVKWVWKADGTTFDETTFKPEPDGVYELKAVWKDSLGEYDIIFINDLTNSSEKRHYYIDGNPPTLPNNPTGDRTHTFRNWVIIDDNGAIQSIYSPTTFSPHRSTTYRFKTNWDSRGVITDILLRQTDYYVGDTISKNSIRVTVADDEGNTRVLGSEEYTITPNTYSDAGWHSPTVTYTRANATATFDVQFKEDKIKTLKAEYTGRDLPVGTKIDKDFINVDVVFESGRTKDDVTDFSITPQRIQKRGANKITVTYLDKTTNVSITGKDGTPELNKKKGDGSDDVSLSAIKAEWTGDTVAYGAPINKTNLTVTRSYDDGTSDIVPAAEYIISPIVADSTGNSTIVTVYYDGFTTTVNVPTGDSGNNDLVDYYRDDDDGSVFDPDAIASDTSEEEASDFGNTGYVDSTANTGSSYYLHGRNIFDDFMSYGPSQPMNDVDIQQIIQDIPDGTLDHTITLINNSIGDQLTPSILSQLRDKGTRITLDMTDDTGNSVISWTIDPEKMEDVDIQSDFDPNVTIEQYPRTTDEICVGYSVNNYPEFATLSANLVPYGIKEGDPVEYYKLDTADWTPQGHVTHSTITTGESGSIHSPDTYFAVSSKTDEYYPEEYNLYNEYPWPSLQAAMTSYVDDTENVEQSEGTPTGFDEFTGDPNLNASTQDNLNPQQTLIKKLKVPLIALGGILLVIIVVGVILVIRKRKAPVQRASISFEDDEGDYAEDEEVEDEEEEEEEEELEEDLEEEDEEEEFEDDEELEESE